MDGNSTRQQRVHRWRACATAMLHVDENLFLRCTIRSFILLSHGRTRRPNIADIRTFDGPVDIDAANSIVAGGVPIWGWTTFPDKNKVGG